MLVSRDALAGALAVAKTDEGASLLGFIAIEPDGTVVAMNKRTVFAAQPVLASTGAKVPLEESDTPLEGTLYLSCDSVAAIVKAIPKDTLFKKLLEHASIRTVSNSASVIVETTDGKEKHTLRVNRARLNSYPDWRKGFTAVWQQAASAPPSAQQLAWNRKRLVAAVEALELACKYDGEFAPLFITLGRGMVLWRGVNELTGQRLLITFAESEIVEGVPELNAWERELLASPAANTKIKLRIKK